MGTESERAVETNIGLRLFVARFLAVLLFGFGRGGVGGVVVARGLICGGERRGKATGFAIIFGMMAFVGFRWLLFLRFVSFHKCSSTGIREPFESFTA